MSAYDEPRATQRADEFSERLLRIRNLHHEGPDGQCDICWGIYPCATARLAAGLPLANERSGL